MNREARFRLTKKNVSFFFDEVSVAERNVLKHRLLTTDTQYRWGIGHQPTPLLFLTIVIGSAKERLTQTSFAHRAVAYLLAYSYL